MLGSASGSAVHQAAAPTDRAAGSARHDQLAAGRGRDARDALDARAGELAEDMPALRPNERLEDALGALLPAPVGRRLDELTWPPTPRFSPSTASNSPINPDPDVTLLRGDRITVLVPEAAADQLADALTARHAPSPAPRSQP